jgi:uncharacterized membrane protein YfcA
MPQLTLYLPYLIFLGSGFSFGVLTLLQGTAPFIAPVFLGYDGSFYFAVALFLIAGLSSIFSQLRESIDWKEVFRLGLFFFIGSGVSFYFLFKIYFRYSGTFILVSALLWLLSLPFSPKTIYNRQFTFVPFLSNVFQGLLSGFLIGGLGFAGLPLITPFLQIFRKVDRQTAVSTSVPLSMFSLAAIAVVFLTHRDASASLAFDKNLFALTAALFGVAHFFGLSFAKKLLKSFSPLVLSVIQFALIITMGVLGLKLAKKNLPCFTKNPVSCLACFKPQAQNLGWDKFTWPSGNESLSAAIETVVDSCGRPLAIHLPSSVRSDLIAQLPFNQQVVGLNPQTGNYSEFWDGSRIKRVRKQRVYFEALNCSGNAAISKRKTETQVKLTTIVNNNEYKEVAGTRSGFWYLSYRDAERECNNQSGVIKSSTDLGIYDVAPQSSPEGTPILDEDCCHKFSSKDHFISTLYYADEECQSTLVATDDEGPGEVGHSVLYTQEKYYLIKSKLPSFEYKSFRESGKDCVKQPGMLSPSSERLAYSVEEMERPQDFSRFTPLSIRKLRLGELQLWLDTQK